MFISKGIIFYNITEGIQFGSAYHDIIIQHSILKGVIFNKQRVLETKTYRAIFKTHWKKSINHDQRGIRGKWEKKPPKKNKRLDNGNKNVSIKWEMSFYYIIQSFIKHIIVVFILGFSSWFRRCTTNFFFVGRRIIRTITAFPINCRR